MLRDDSAKLESASAMTASRSSGAGAFEPHLEALGFRRLVEQADFIRTRAAGWLTHSLNVSPRLQAFQLADLEAGRPIDRRCLSLERSAAFYADELLIPKATCSMKRRLPGDVRGGQIGPILSQP
jgi:hypothetical protein